MHRHRERPLEDRGQLEQVGDDEPVLDVLVERREDGDEGGEEGLRGDVQLTLVLRRGGGSGGGCSNTQPHPPRRRPQRRLLVGVSSGDLCHLPQFL